MARQFAISIIKMSHSDPLTWWNILIRVLFI